MLDSVLMVLPLFVIGLVAHLLTDDHIWLVFFGGLALFTFAVMET